MDRLTMTRRQFGMAALAVGATFADRTPAEAAAAQSPRPAKGTPIFQVDPNWPKIPNSWVFGPVTSIRVDERDHVWILQRPRSVAPEHKGHEAPPVLEYGADGNFLRGWGGPGAGYDWPENEHGFEVADGFVWIVGNNPNFGRSRPNQTFDNMLVKFSTSGKFALQIGGRNRVERASDTTALGEPADCCFHKGEIFVADGYGNRRLIVFDGNTGKFKRMWGAFGRPPEDQPKNVPFGAPGVFDSGEGPELFGIVHAVRVSKDGMVYVGDRDNRRVQVFTLEGKYLRQVFINMAAGPSRTACGITFSGDAQQRIMYVCDFDHGVVFAYDRATLALLGSMGVPHAIGSGSKGGRTPGELIDPHYLATDSHGNLYSSETAGGRRAQKFIFKGFA